MAQASYRVRGLMCSSCLAKLLDAVRSVAGVVGVAVDLVRGGASNLSVTGSGPPEPDAIDSAVRRAGFAMATPDQNPREVRS